MVFVTFAYFLATLVIGGAKIIEGDTWGGLSFLLAGLCAYWGGSALKTGLFAPAGRPRNVALIMAAAFTAVGLLATHETDVQFEAYGHPMPGVAWVLAGLIAGILGTKRRRIPVVPKA